MPVKKTKRSKNKKVLSKDESDEIVSAIPLPLFEIAQEKVFTVSSFLDYLNNSFGKETFFVTGEISSFQNHPSGVYFSMKDKEGESVMYCYMSPWVYRSLGILLEEGMEIKAGGAPNIYKPKGRFSFKVESVELTGEGSLKKAYDALKRKLEQEGLFERKRALPEFIQKIGVITSRTGAVIDDFRKNLEKRGMRVFLCDARVEGTKAVPEITRAIRWFNTRMPDLDILVIIRGGGSLEDLQAFNNEIVAREIFGSRIPTICGIGHDRDIPIASLVADHETSTPSIAAMLINTSWNRLKEELPDYQSRIIVGYEGELDSRAAEIVRITGAFLGYFRLIETHYQNLRMRIRSGAQKLEARFGDIELAYKEISIKIATALTQGMMRIGERLNSYDTYLAGVSPERNLKLGYSIITNQKGRVVRSVEDVEVGENIKSRLHKGEFVSEVKQVKKE